MQMTTLIPALILLVTQSKTAVGDVFTAMADMEGLIATEFELVKHLDTYIQEEEKRMTQLRGWKMKKTQSAPQRAKISNFFFFFSLRQNSRRVREHVPGSHRRCAEILGQPSQCIFTCQAPHIWLEESRRSHQQKCWFWYMDIEFFFHQF